MRNSTRTTSEKARATTTRPGSATSGRPPKPHSAMLCLSVPISSSRSGRTGRFCVRIVPVFGGKAAADVQSRQFDAGPVAHPVRRGQSPFVGLGLLDLASDMEAQADLEADPVETLHQFDGMAGRRAELPRKLVERVALGLQPHEDGHGSRVEIERAHDSQDLGDFVLVVEREHANAVGLERQPDVRLGLDRVHVEHLRLLGGRAHGRELARRGHVEGPDAGLDQRGEHHRLAVRFHRIGRLPGKQRHEPPGVRLEHGRPEAIERRVRPEGESCFAPGGELLHRALLVRARAYQAGTCGKGRPAQESG